MDDLVTWLRAQLDEEERAATDRGRLAGDVWTAVEVAPGRWEVVGSGGRGVIAQGLPQWEAEHIARHDPARVLRQVERDRRILDAHSGGMTEGPCSVCCGGVWDCDPIALPCPTIKLLALPHAGRPGYRSEWALA